jgi:hypothetical protein
MTEQRKDLGWANGWRADPPEVTRCRVAGHRMQSADIAAIKMRGLDTLYWCDICKIQYHVDSSD